MSFKGNQKERAETAATRARAAALTPESPLDSERLTMKDCSIPVSIVVELFPLARAGPSALDDK